MGRRDGRYGQADGKEPMNEVDEMFALLRGEPLPASLGTIDDAVLSGLAAGRDRLVGRRGLALACGVAAVVGLGGGLALPASAFQRDHADTETLFGLPAAAPSHLLAS
jgi:hypothetical protein